MWLSPSTSAAGAHPPRAAIWSAIAASARVMVPSELRSPLTPVLTTNVPLIGVADTEAPSASASVVIASVSGLVAPLLPTARSSRLANVIGLSGPVAVLT
uniref:Uncharacterized protein n=1 Tax=Candidatus Methanogaster sp. ANME-2c ERB4 TaxID=2759911 RepID=A0A7G9YI40_9EURY|nr:hypothetical protein BBPFCCNM_00003 [Methanosarcinales archaeon ANME-2c ERB4]